MGAQAKIINMLLYDGELNGVIRIEDSNWNAGELFSAPRESVSDLLKTGACNKYGVYLLLSADMVYVGQSSDLAKRLTQHISGKDWWESVVILTTKDDSLNHSDIDFLENVLIERAFAIKKLDCDNRKSGNPPKVDVFRKVYLGQYLEEALFLMQLIGVRIFSSDQQKKKGRKKRAKATSLPLNIISSSDAQDKVEASKIDNHIIPPLPDRTLKAGKYVRTAIENLANSGYVFSEEMIEQLCSADSMKTVIGMQRNMPFFKKYAPTDKQGHMVDGRPRFYSKPISFGSLMLYLNSQIYESDREPFEKWYKSLDAKAGD